MLYLHYNLKYNKMFDLEYEKSLRQSNLYLDKFNQSKEDYRVTRHINSEAYRLYDEYLNAKELEYFSVKENKTIKFKNYYPVIKLITIYTIYDNSTAKYEKVDYIKEILKKYRELIDSEKNIYDFT